MFKLGILKGNDKYSKTWTTCGSKKGARRKNRYVDDWSYERYIKIKK